MWQARVLGLEEFVYKGGDGLIRRYRKESAHTGRKLRKSQIASGVACIYRRVPNQIVRRGIAHPRPYVPLLPIDVGHIAIHNNDGSYEWSIGGEKIHYLDWIRGRLIEASAEDEEERAKRVKVEGDVYKQYGMQTCKRFYTVDGDQY